MQKMPFHSYSGGLIEPVASPYRPPSSRTDAPRTTGAKQEVRSGIIAQRNAVGPEVITENPTSSFLEGILEDMPFPERISHLDRYLPSGAVQRGISRLVVPVAGERGTSSGSGFGFGAHESASIDPLGVRLLTVEFKIRVRSHGVIPWMGGRITRALTLRKLIRRILFSYPTQIPLFQRPMGKASSELVNSELLFGRDFRSTGLHSLYNTGTDEKVRGGLFFPLLSYTIRRSSVLMSIIPRDTKGRVGFPVFEGLERSNG
ncbi:hypothetical protein SCHPADRAFT_411297 [Schizopora paradoxa]|uniref:Uncharacterized protein n=1 Tax=Schizopora paradoxa TaxID=27342 RepID=A0A0H2S6U8_9AGAM|nr:hypothetical protein SCHPADRAFT_411297 [Schizopora paradoxa]